MWIGYLRRSGRNYLIILIAWWVFIISYVNAREQLRYRRNSMQMIIYYFVGNFFLHVLICNYISSSFSKSIRRIRTTLYYTRVYNDIKQKILKAVRRESSSCLAIFFYETFLLKWYINVCNVFYDSSVLRFIQFNNFTSSIWQICVSIKM